MSVEHLELALYELTTKRESGKAYREDPRAFLSAFVLTDLERAMLNDADVLGLYRAGVSPLLVMGFWLDTLRRPIQGYVRALNPGSTSDGEA